MEIIRILSLLIISANIAFADKTKNQTFDCVDIKGTFLGTIFLSAAKNLKDCHQHINYFLATKHHTNHVDISNETWSNILKLGFDAHKKTYIIMHGFQSHSSMVWVHNMKMNILNLVDVNIILVDWQAYSSCWNYVDAVRATPLVKNNILKFLTRLHNEFLQSLEEDKSGRRNRNQRAENSKVLWNNFYFIGHSLGAHLSGQVSHSLKNEKFFTVERITGLDPAQPCFAEVAPELRLDQSDAHFVDVYHTQVGSSDRITDGFGIKKQIGHADFYLNGGVMQPACEGSIFSLEMSRMICSHQIVIEYFIESVKSPEVPISHKFFGHKWNRNYHVAVKLLEDSFKHKSCPSCVEMGFNARKTNTGVFLAFTGVARPYYALNQTDLPKIKQSLARLVHTTPVKGDCNNNNCY